VAYDERSGDLRVEKVLTVVEDRARGVMQGLKGSGASTEAITDFIHGTTTSTNAVIERKTSPTGLVTTRGFRDVLELMRGDRPLPVYDISWRKPDALIPRNARFEIDERIDAQGNVILPLDEQELRTLLRGHAFEGLEAVAVSFLHSFVNESHEREAARIISEERPELFVSLSCDVDPEVREYERTSTVALDAMLKPLMTSYLRSLDDGLRSHGLSGEVFVMLANAGVMPLAGAEERPILTLHSGPAGGVVGASLLAAELGRRNLITADMGGTSFDVCAIVNGSARFRSEGAITWGIPFRVPLVDVGTIGAGGGSIAWVDPGGLLRVGPRSAGAAPGPACYGLGGTDPTITDACCFLGYFGDEGLAGGAIRLRRELADGAMEQLARRLKKSREFVANGMLQIAIANMAGEIRKNSVERGDDPREFSLFSFGGAGSMFATVLARDLGMPEVIIPPNPGVFSALGMLGAELRYDVRRTFYGELAETSASDLARSLAELEHKARERLGDAAEEAALSRELALRYVGQRHELRVPLASGAVTRRSLEEARQQFDRLHGHNYGHARHDDRVELRTIAVVATIARPKPRFVNTGRARPEDALKARRRVHLAGASEATDVPVYDRNQLASGSALYGPAILESADATVVLYPGERARVHATGSVIADGWR
jgi:N-methylhydantoinase A/oxoprolinase/acetone carboxylase beta subunit